MSVTSSLYSGISGLVANGDAMGVIGNNIANVNTTGFKQARTLFADVLSNTISNGSQVGRGVQIQAVENQHIQGSFESTESPTDLAIQGDSFFVVQTPTGRFYTRAGAFHFDAAKQLVTPEGAQVMGYGIGGQTGTSNGILGPIDLTQFATTPPRPTTLATMVLNLDATQQVPGVSAATISSAVAFGGNLNQATSPATAPVTVYDDAGIAHAGTATFTYTGAGNDWLWNVAVAGSAGGPLAGTASFNGAGGTLSALNMTSGNPLTINGSQQSFSVSSAGMTQTAAPAAMTATADGSATSLPWDPANPVATSNYSVNNTVYDSQGNAHTATTYFRKTGANAWEFHVLVPDATAGSPVSGTLSFNSDGALVNQTPAAGSGQNLTFPGGVTVPQAVAFDFVAGGTTQYASASVVSQVTQDGYAQGSLVKVSVDDKGFVNGTYSNGQLAKVAQVALAKFSSVNGLAKAGSNLFEETSGSGAPMLSNASTPGIGKIFSNSLEQSNVDLAAQFVRMITVQRGYSANGKTITTTDEMLQEVLNLKR